MNLRDRGKLNKPYKFSNYLMEAEELMNELEHPETFQDALQSGNCTEWEEAVKREISSLEENLTWELKELLKGCKAIPCKWVYRTKMNSDGIVDKFKARLVIKGQRYGIDYNQTFRPVAKMSSIRSILSIAASEGMFLSQFDVSTTFLYEEIRRRYLYASTK